MSFEGIVGVLQESQGRYNGMPNYYNNTKGGRVLTKRCTLFAQNSCIVFIPN